MTIRVTITHDEPGSNRTLSVVRALTKPDGSSEPQGPVIELSAGQSESFNIWGDMYVVVAETPLQQSLDVPTEEQGAAQ
jgi:hypothetical protein